MLFENIATIFDSKLNNKRFKTKIIKTIPFHKTLLYALRHLIDIIKNSKFPKMLKLTN